MEKAYEAQKYEDDIYKRWEESGFFDPDVCIKAGITQKDAPHFSIVLPPPNVTGTLHIGHASMLAIQDVMIRYHRMKGDRTLWVPGTDHAAVATESKVEKLLITEEGFIKPKEELGKEKFMERVKKFAQESHDTIINQTKKMGSSLDWGREAFTLDDKRNLAVRTVFKKMYDDGLIYRGHRVINWSVKGQSTCSDDELVSVERQGKIYTFKYSVDFPIEIATTRPETKLGDTAVAVNPKDKRYKKFIGETFVVENFADSGVNLKLKIIANENVDMEYGTGAVGVTPAHSGVDFDMYLVQKSAGNEIDLIQVIGKDGKMTELAGKYSGFTTLEAREKVVEALKKNNLFIKEEETVQNVGTSDRFGDVVEALPMTQWFVNVNKEFQIGDCRLQNIKKGQMVTLKKLMQEVVKSGQIEIIPERFNKTYFHWIDNLRDWCISRQIWYGHQIPVWYKKGTRNKEQGTSDIFVDVNPPEDIENWEQDPDTLDTWFSSGLWTFSTLGYPDLEAPDLKNYHPTSVMETGYDILFFWVARMILMTTYTLGEIPFEKVYLHGLVRDEEGRKMSKSLGNVIDPLDVCKKYGTDAVRLSLLIGNTPGNDCKLSEEKIAGFRNFSNKLWNIARFIEGTRNKEQVINESDDKVTPYSLLLTPFTLADKWILNRLNEVIKSTTDNIEKFNFSQAGELLRDFTWNDLADWYLEIAKIEARDTETRINADVADNADNKSRILNYILQIILKLWHPFMPFVTEQIWSEIYGKEQSPPSRGGQGPARNALACEAGGGVGRMLLIEKWPSFAKAMEGKPDVIARNDSDEAISGDFQMLQNIITNIRIARAENKIEPVKKLNVVISAGDKKVLLEENTEIIKVLARVENLQIEKTAVKQASSIGFVESGVEVFVDLSGAVDTEKEKVRLEKEKEELGKYIKGLDGKLGNKEFVNNAPPAVVEKEQKKLTEAKDKLAKILNQLEGLK